VDPAGALIRRLVDARDPAFDPAPFEARVAESVLGPPGAPLTPHRRLLELDNGGYYHGHALHVFGACQGPPWHALPSWNAPATWRDAYGEAPAGLVFFAEDAFGDQFAYRGAHAEVVIFEADLGRVVPFAPHFLGWLEEMVERPARVLPLDVLAQQRAERRLHQAGTHLFGWPPLSTVESRAGVSIGHVDAVEAMRFRGQLAGQLGGLAPGTRVRLELDGPSGPVAGRGDGPTTPEGGG